MKCPRTGTALKEITIDGIKLDFSEACGGVWFDNYELMKFDEAHEAGGEALIELMAKHQQPALDLNQRLQSPRHPEITMIRRYYSPKRRIEIDECPMSGGIWLDAGELAAIRDLFPTQEDRERAGRTFVNEVAHTSDFEAMIAESAEKKEKAQKVAHLLQWLCPSRYIPGKQDWGSF
jgi:uncharacterized protein